MDSGRVNKHAKRFFLIYSVVITAMLLWGLFHCTEVTWETRYAYAQAEDAGEQAEADSHTMLTDSQPVTAFTADLSDSLEKIDEKARLYGAAIVGFENVNGLRFTQETVQLDVCEADSREVLGSGLLLLRNHTPYEGDGTEMYVPLSEPLSDTLNQKLLLRFSSHGLTKNGIRFQEKKVGEDANLEAGDPLVELYYQKKIWAPFMSLFYFILEAAVGMAGLILFNKRAFPLTAGRSPSEKVGKAGSMFRKKDLLTLAVVLGLIFFLISYTYVTVVRKTAASSSAELLVPVKEAEDTVTLSPGESIRQIIVPRADSLSGIGIQIENPDSGKKTGTMLEWTLYDENGKETLTRGSAAVSGLKKVKEILPRTTEDEAVVEAAETFVQLPLDNIVEDTAGRRLLLELSVPGQDTEEDAALSFLASGLTNSSAEYMDNEKKAEETVEADTDVSGTEICLMGIYRNNGFLNGMFLCVGMILLLMLCALFFAARFCRERTALMYLCSALCMGMIFSFMTPAYTVSDERTHIDTVYIVSNRLLGINDEPGPLRAYRRACDVDTSLMNTMPVSVQRYRAAATELFLAADRGGGDSASAQESAAYTEGLRPAQGRELTPAYSRNALANVPIICYIPSALGFTAARLLGRNMITMIMAARWMNLLASVLVIWLALRRIPYGAACMAVIGLFPKTLQMMSSCSYDGMIIAGTFLFIAYALAASCDDNFSVRDFMILLLTGFFVASCKGGVFLPVLGLVLMIPFSKVRKIPSGGKKRRLWMQITLLVPLSAVILFAGKYVKRLLGFLIRSSDNATAALGSRKVYAPSDFIRSPIKLVRIYIHTFFVRGDGLIGELVGKNLSQRWYLIYTFIGLAFLGVLAWSHSGRSQNKKNEGPAAAVSRPGPAGRLWILFLALCSAALIFLSMVLAFTTKGSLMIEGLQGRYFLPIAPLIFFAMDNKKIRRDGISDGALLYTADVLLAFTFCEIMLVYLGKLLNQ
jgi:uncharacterized membrane protein